jgi:cell division protein FtsL
MYANRTIRIASSLISGVGVGLFIDEVGKFITQTNNYFTPIAAPIIYVLFLLSVFLYIDFRRRKQSDVRAELYSLLQQMEELIDRDLSASERIEMLERLQRISKNAKEKDQALLAEQMTQLLQKPEIIDVEPIPSFFEKLREKWLQFEEKHFSHKRIRFYLSIGLLLLAIWMALLPIRTISLWVRDPANFHELVNSLVQQKIILGLKSFTLYIVLIAIEALVGFLIFVSSLLMILRSEKAAVGVGYLTLLATIVIFNLFIFYFDQFSTIAMTIYEFLLIGVLMRYRTRFFEK